MSRMNQPKQPTKPKNNEVVFRGAPAWLHPETLATARRILCREPWRFAFGLGERAVFRCRKPIPVSQWAERHRVLHQSSRPGRWHNAVTPYTTGIMDASFFPSVRSVTMMKCPQSGGTEAVHNCIGYAVDRAPGPVLYVYPDEATAKENAQDRVIPMLMASPRLREYMTGMADDLSALRIKLAHMTIHMAWSGSASRLGNKPIRHLVLDELDKYQNQKKEASSEALAEKRVITWGRKARIWKISTPTVVDGPIHRAWQQAEARYSYHVICPHCGAELLMDFEHIHWPEDTGPVQIQSRSLAWYECQHCAAHWTDADRDEAVRRGCWREDESGLALMEHLEAARPMSVAFHIPAWISPFVKLSDVAAIACSCALSGDRMEKKDLQNNFRAEPWEEEFETRTEDAILALCDDRPRGVVPGPETLPDGRSRARVACLLAGVDTQLRYFRYVIRAFGYGDDAESWLVQEGVAPSLAALDELFWNSEYSDSAGTRYKVRAVMIDAMGHPERTAAVYAWAAKHRGLVFPSQGVHSPASPIAYAPQEYFPGMKGERIKIPGGILLHRVDTTLFKGMLAAKLAIQAGDPGAFYLHAADAAAVDARNGSLLGYAKEMCAEIWNAEKNMWDNPHGRPNHAFDCEYYLQALAWMLHVSKARRPEERPATAPPRPPMPKAQALSGRAQAGIQSRGAAAVLAGLRRA